MGSGGVDIMMSAAARDALPVSIESKNTRGTPSVSQLKQSRANAYDGTLPGVVWKPHGKKYEESLIMFTLEEFLEFWRDHGNKEGS